MEKKFLVKTMTCHHCESAIKDTLSKLEGVKSIDVNLDDKIVTSAEIGRASCRERV